MDLKTFIIVAVIKIALLVFILLTAVAYTTLLERKLVARIQNRWSTDCDTSSIGGIPRP